MEYRNGQIDNLRQIDNNRVPTLRQGENFNSVMPQKSLQIANQQSENQIKNSKQEIQSYNDMFETGTNLDEAFAEPQGLRKK